MALPCRMLKYGAGFRIALYIKASGLISFNGRVAHLSSLFTSWIDREPIERCLCPVD